MIVTVTPNGSVDTVLLRLGPPGDEEQQVRPLAHTAGGKGHNVAQFLAAAGEAVTACGFAGGWAGRELEALLAASGVRADLTAVGDQSAPIRHVHRRTASTTVAAHARADGQPSRV